MNASHVVDIIVCILSTIIFVTFSNTSQFNFNIMLTFLVNVDILDVLFYQIFLLSLSENNTVSLLGWFCSYLPPRYFYFEYYPTRG